MLALVRFRPAVLTGLFFTTLAFTGCKKDHDPDPVTEAKKAAVATYATIAVATYEDALAAAQVLDQKAQAFVTNPTAAGLDEVKTAWKSARVPYDQTDAFRFYGGPIDDPDTGVEGKLNAWPLDENYIDYTQAQPGAGIINDAAAYPTISKAVLDTLNEKGGEKNIAVGYHAIEFLLWGQDLSVADAGTRPFTDYTTAPNAARRGQYLLACTSLLVDHLQYVVTTWKSSYRAKLLAMPVSDALQKIMVGLGSLSKGELAGERMQVALDNQDQEDEHSCFSDYTDRDLKGNDLGIRNVVTGSYTRTNGTTVSGPSLNEAVQAANAAQGSALYDATQDALVKVQAIQAPFDQEIVGADSAPGRQRVRAAVLACRSQGDQLVQAAHTLGITLVF